MTFNIGERIKLKIYTFFKLFFQTGKILKPEICASQPWALRSSVALCVLPILSESTSCATVQSIITSQQWELPKSFLAWNSPKEITNYLPKSPFTCPHSHHILNRCFLWIYQDYVWVTSSGSNPMFLWTSYLTLLGLSFLTSKEAITVLTSHGCREG